MKRSIAGLVTVLTLAGTRTSAIAAFGDPIPNLTPAQLEKFLDGKEEFEKLEGIDDGLGPVFTGPVPPLEDPMNPGQPAMACATCHDQPTIGGSSTRALVETRYGYVDSTGHFDPLSQLGGTLRKHNGIGIVAGIAGHPECDGFEFTGDNVPAQANVTANRRTTNVAGLSFVDKVPDVAFIALAAIESVFSRETAGRVSFVQDALTGQTVVGKFGWKSAVPRLLIFAGDAYVNEMGITNFIFPNENCPQGNCSLLTCNPDQTAPNDQPDPVTGITDTEKFANFMSMLDLPPQATHTPLADIGGLVFAAAGCINCHTPTLTTGRNPEFPALDNRDFEIFGDFLLHDMGALADGIEQGAARRFEMRTAPLRGLRFNVTDGHLFLLHDGRATTIEQAILLHDGCRSLPEGEQCTPQAAGQGARSAQNFARLSSFEKSALLAFLNRI